MSDLERDPPNTNADTEADQRDRERELHRAQLEAVRSAFSAGPNAPGPKGGDPEPGPGPAPAEPDPSLRTQVLVARLSADVVRLERKQRSAVRVVVALGLALALGAATLAAWAVLRLQDPYLLDEISARSIRADRIALTQDLRLLDPAGRELAVLGRDPAARGGSGGGEPPVILALTAQGDPSRQLLRFAASKAGAALTVEAPTGGSSVSLLSTLTGSSVEIRNGAQKDSLVDEGSVGLPAVSAGAPGREAPAVALREAPLRVPPRSGPPDGRLPEVHEVGHGFLVADLATQRAGDGVELRGRVVNGTALVHSGVSFRVTLAGTSAIVTVPKISPGNSTGFRVTLPGVVTDDASDAGFEYLGSTVAFQASSTEPIYGRQLETR